MPCPFLWFGVGVRVIGLTGSLRPDSSNSSLLRLMAAAAAAREDVDVEVWEHIGELPHFAPELEGDEVVVSLRAAIGGSDAVLIATPEYAGGMPGSLKNALDWLVGGGELYGKPLAVLSAAPSTERGGNARAWVEAVASMQGATVVASFTVATSTGPTPGEVRDEATLALDRVVEAFETRQG